MSVGVVVALEIVDIEQQHRNLFAGFIFAPQEAVEGAAVGEAGQSVGCSELGEAAVELGQFVFHPLAFGDVADDAEEFRPGRVARFRRQLELAFHPRQRSVAAIVSKYDGADAVDAIEPCGRRFDALPVVAMHQVEA